MRAQKHVESIELHKREYKCARPSNSKARITRVCRPETYRLRFKPRKGFALNEPRDPYLCTEKGALQGMTCATWEASTSLLSELCAVYSLSSCRYPVKLPRDSANMTG